MDKYKLEQFAESLTEKERSVFAVLIDTLSSTTNNIKELAMLPANLILTDEEQLEYWDIAARINTSLEHKLDTGSSLVSIIKSTRLCNLRCTYCHSWRNGPNQVMKFSVLVRAIAYSLAPQNIKNVQFVWHGGEATLLPINYYKKAIWLQEQFRRQDQSVSNVIQTNGTLLTDAWIDFIIEYGLSVGVSLDGPPEINDRRRIDKKGNPTSAKVKLGLEKLNAKKIKHGLLIVIDNDMVELGAQKLLTYLVDELQVKNVAILNAIPENKTEDQSIIGSYLTWPKYITFLKELFFLWWHKYRQHIDIRELSSLVKTIQKNSSPSICIYAGNCMGKYITIDPNGDVSACDKYIEAPDYVFGNLMQQESFIELYKQSNNLNKAYGIENKASKKMQNCRWFNVCNGGCPHDRRLNEKYTEHFDGYCCGLSSLIEDIYLTVQSNTNKLCSQVIDGKEHVWNVERLWSLSENICINELDVHTLMQKVLDKDCWFRGYEKPTTRNTIAHFERIQAADLSYPIILTPDGTILDGVHRLVKAYMQQKEQIKVVKFNELPKPDFILEKAFFSNL